MSMANVGLLLLSLAILSSTSVVPQMKDMMVPEMKDIQHDNGRFHFLAQVIYIFNRPGVAGAVL